MSTRGYIAIQHDDGTCEGFYNHFDNYPEGTGATLLSTPGCATGDLKTIQKALDNDEERLGIHSHRLDWSSWWRPTSWMWLVLSP